MVKYDVEVKTFAELKNKIEIPRFQRGLVWNDDKKGEFIRTLKAGLPIGVLLLSKRGDKYLVIDGLQRFTTMIDYSKDFFKYISSEEITDSDLMAIILSSSDAKAIYDDYPATVQQKMRDDMRKIVAKNISGGQDKNYLQISRAVANQLCKEISMLPDKDLDNIIDSVYAVIDRISQSAQIDDITIPLIIFKGKEDELADIYQKLNQEGVRLSKYDVFAATWIDHYVTVKNDPSFIEYIIKKYERSKEDSNLDIADYDPDEMKRPGKLTVFEYAFAVGKALMEKCKKLFPRVDDAKIDSIGFLILAELMGLSSPKMNLLAETMEKYKALDYKKLKDAILEVGSIVESALGSYIEAPSKSKASLACHSEFQLASYIIVIFKLKYELTPENGLVQRQKNKSISCVKDFLYKHYLFDILRGYWAGSGDSKIEDIIADPSTCRYTRDVAKDEFEMAISSWLDAANDKPKQMQVPMESKLFLNYLLRGRVHNVGKTAYDIEHCVPKDVVRRYYLDKGIMVPMSSVCNLAYIPSKDNRSKGELTYYQRQDNEPGTFALDEAQLDLLGYPRREDLRFVESTSTLTKENFDLFLKERKQTIQQIMMSVLYND